MPSPKVSDLVSIPLGIGSAIRNRRVFHPLGVLATGHLERLAPSGTGLPVQSGDVLGRVSKAVGTPGGLPDLVGLAWRMFPGDGASTPWDVLTVSAGSGLLTRFTLRPAVTWSNTTFSTLMALHRDDGWWWLTATLKTPVDGGLTLDAIDGGGVSFDIAQAHGTGPFQPLARLTLDSSVPTDEEHDVSFDPTRNTAPGATLGPEWLTTLRERAYRFSRRGRHAPDQSAL